MSVLKGWDPQRLTAPKHDPTCDGQRFRHGICPLTVCLYVKELCTAIGESLVQRGQVDSVML